MGKIIFTILHLSKPVLSKPVFNHEHFSHLSIQTLVVELSGKMLLLSTHYLCFYAEMRVMPLI